MGFSIRNVDPRPIHRELLEVYRRAYMEWKEYAYHTDQRILDYIKWLRKRAPEGFLVAFADGRPMGFIAVDYNWVDYKGDSVGEIHELVVDPEFQDRGIGKRLLLSGLEVLVEKGCRRFGLWVGRGNTKAQALYGNLGFRIEEHGNVWIRMVKD